jgi:hypothetical protein
MRDEAGRDVVRLGKLVFAVVVGAAGAALTLGQLHDRIWPPVTVFGGEIVSADLLQVGVSQGRYIEEHPYLYPNRKQTLDGLGPAVTKPGAVVAVVVRVEGLRGHECIVKATLYRAPFTPVIGPAKAGTCTAHVQDGDEGGWEAWIALPGGRSTVAHRYFVRFDLYAKSGLLIGPGLATKTFGWNGETATQ